MLVSLAEMATVVPLRGQGSNPTPPTTSGSLSTALALTGAKVYTSPSATAIPIGAVIIRDGKIIAVGSQQSVAIPDDATVIDCGGLVITAGFQNSHIHFTEPKWNNAKSLPPDRLANQLEEMLTQYGFTTVVDTGSILENTGALRRRVESGEIPGPRILTAGEVLFPQGGLPYYVRDALDAATIAKFPRPATPQAAEQVVEELITDGADLIKLYAVSAVTQRNLVAMNVDVAKAATSEAHRRGKLVFVHPTNAQGMEIALEAGADVLAHAVEIAPDWNETTIARLKAEHISMIPTLHLFKGNLIAAALGRILTRTDVVGEVGSYWRADGQILFGTDAGYLPDYDPTGEYVLMSRAGMNFPAILESLTTAPAERFGESNKRGRIAPGMDGDVVVLGGDPASDVRWFGRAKYTVRAGRIIHSSTPRPLDQHMRLSLALVLFAIAGGALLAAIWFWRSKKGVSST